MARMRQDSSTNNWPTTSTDSETPMTSEAHEDTLPDFDDLDLESLERLVHRGVTEIARRRHGRSLPASDPARPVTLSDEPIPYAGRVFGPEEVLAATRSTLDFWLTLGEEGEQFERELAQVLGVRRSILTNSGSSANLLALSALTSPLVDADRRLRPGDEVITCAAGFPTTVAPIVQTGCVPVFLDADPTTGNMRTDLLEDALSDRTRAVMLAHSLGNPFDLARIVRFCQDNDLWLIEDNCDALGSMYSMPAAIAQDLGLSGTTASTTRVERPTGTWGDLSTQSFYPPHHISLGEGGAVNIVSTIGLRRAIESFRDWGRDCWCPSGHDDTCGKRFDWKLGGLPDGYDHKYTYSHLGYNLKPLDVQAAIGRVQLQRLDAFSSARRSNWQALRAGLDDMHGWYEFALPTHATRWTLDGFEWDVSGNRSDPSWFGFMLRVRPEAPFTASELARHLDRNRIGNRRLFGGNLTRQPAFVQLAQDRSDAYRIVGDLSGADTLMHQAVFIGTYPGLTTTMIERMIDILRRAPGA